MQLGEAKNSGISLDFSRNCKKTLGKTSISSKNLEEIQEKYPMMGLICARIICVQSGAQQYLALAHISTISLLGIDSLRREPSRWRQLSHRFSFARL